MAERPDYEPLVGHEGEKRADGDLALYEPPGAGDEDEPYLPETEHV